MVKQIEVNDSDRTIIKVAKKYGKKQIKKDMGFAIHNKDKFDICLNKNKKVSHTELVESSNNSEENALESISQLSLSDNDDQLSGKDSHCYDGDSS